MTDPINRYKVILLGTIDVGKTSIIIRFTEDTFTDSIPGELDQKSRDVEVDAGRAARVILTDTAGQERFRTLTSSYYRNADAIILVFDLANQESFSELDGHYQEGCRYSSRSQKFLVGNKSDLERTIPSDQAEKWARDHSVPYFEVSAKTGEGVQELFVSICKSLMSSGFGQKPAGGVDLTAGGSSSGGGKKGCC